MATIPLNLWSQSAHIDLVQMSFLRERADCRQELQRGSEWVDRVSNQVPSKSYLHAMRSSEKQSIEEAKNLMSEFVATHYEMALRLKEASVEETANASEASNDVFTQFTHDGHRILDMPKYLEHCYERGIALHPVMDSTSPAHADFAIWSITDIEGMLHHGDFLHTQEDDLHLAANKSILGKSIQLMRITDTIYLELKQLDYRWGN